MNFSDPFSNITDFSERNLVEKLGLNLENIREFRKKHLTDGVHYSYAKFNVVTYTKEGFERLLQYCGLRKEIGDSSPIDAIITQFPPNKNMLIARLEDGREVRVRVKSKHNFVIGKRIKIQRDPGGLFELSSSYPNKSKFVTVLC